MNYKVGVIKRVAFLLMTMALAVAMVACEGAVGKPGLPGEPGKPGEPADPALQPPYVALALPDLPALVQGMSYTVDLSTAFGDPDGETLTLSAKSTDPAIATAKVSGKTLTVTGVKVGTTSVVVTATDADDLKVSQSVQVTVTAAPPEPDPPVTIDDVKTKYPTLVITPTTAADVSMEIELPAEHTLESENQSVVTVARKMAAAPASSIRWAAATADTTANMWVVTAVAKGLTNVDVLDKSGASVHTIRVRVATNPPAPEPDPVAPTKAADIPDQKLYKDDGAATIDLSDHFTHEMDIMYEASSDPTGFVSTKVAEGILTLTPRVTGQTIVTVTATADGKNATDEFTVTVMAGSKPTPTPSDPPTKVGAIMVKEVEVGAALDAMDVSGYFSPTGLIYTAESTNTGIATETISGSNLTITGVAIGTTTVTVTATDLHRNLSATQTINVTVTAAMADYKPPTVTIKGVDEVKDVRIDAGQTLLSLSEDHVRLDRKGTSPTVWTLKGLKKTDVSAPVTVRIRNQNGEVDMTISVTVKNTKPERTDTVLSTFLTIPEKEAEFEDGSLTTGGLVDEEGMPLKDEDVTAKKRQYHLLKYPTDIFEDADGTGDIKEYRVESLDTLVRVVRGLTTEGVVLDVTKKIGRDFTLEVYAVDKSDEMSDPATLRVTSIAPRPDHYKVTQNADEFADGESVDVAWRAGVLHKVTVLAFVESPVKGEEFYFVKIFREGLATKVTILGDNNDPTFTKPDPILELSKNPKPYFTVSGSEKIEDTPSLTFENNRPVVTFKLGGDAPVGIAALTITYHVAVDTDGKESETTGREWRMKSRTLRMDIVSGS